MSFPKGLSLKRSWWKIEEQNRWQGYDDVVVVICLQTWESNTRPHVKQMLYHRAMTPAQVTGF